MHINEIEELAQDTLFDILKGEYESAKEKYRDNYEFYSNA